jgi:SAM-dependent methyltransferase
MQAVRRRLDCRICGSQKLDHVLPIRPSAIGDAFVSKERLSEQQDVYPLDLYLCQGCGHLQNLDIVNPEILFRDYTYRTSVSLGLVQHFRKYADEVAASLTIKPGSLVVEIGSNDGSLLKAFKSLGMRVQGIDPARKIAQEATTVGIPTIPSFFSTDVANEITRRQGKAQLVCANNVFAHADNLGDIVAGISTLLAPDGVFVFEVSYVPDMIDKMVFDVIYHEHVSHHAVLPLEVLFERHGMRLFDVQRIASKGGSIRGFAQLKTGQRRVNDRLGELKQMEVARGITKPEIYRNYFKAIEAKKKSLLDLLDEAIKHGKQIAGFGASTTTTTLMYHFELGTRISFIADDNAEKQGTYSPGYHIPVVHPKELFSRKPHFVVILAWMYADKIIEKHHKYVELGGRFVTPLPTLLVTPASQG